MLFRSFCFVLLSITILLLILHHSSFLPLRIGNYTIKVQNKILVEFDTRTSEFYYLNIWCTCQTVNKFLVPLLGILSSYLVAIHFQFVSNNSFILYFIIFLFHSFLPVHDLSLPNLLLPPYFFFLNGFSCMNYYYYWFSLFKFIY